MRKYKIYYLNDKNHKVSIDKFESETDEEAVKRIKDIRVSDPTKKIYWEYNDGVDIIQDDGSIKHYDSNEDYWNEKNRSYKWFNRCFDLIYYSIYKFFYNNLNLVRLWYKIGYAYSRVTKGYDKRDVWNVDSSVYNLLKKLVPEFIKNTEGCPDKYIELAKKIKTENKDENINMKYSNLSGDTDTELGFELWKQDLNELLLNIYLLEYYDNYGLQNEEYYINPQKFPIPYLECSRIIDYKKNFELREQVKNKIFDFLRDNLDGMWY